MGFDSKHNFALHTVSLMGFPHISVGKESACHAGDPGSVSGPGRSAGEGNRLPTPVFLGLPWWLSW